MSKTVESENSTNHNKHPYMVDSNWFPDEQGNYRFKYLFNRPVSVTYRERLLAIQEEAMKSKRSKSDGIHFAKSPRARV